MLLALAWKNIWRNKKRSLIIIAAIAFGLWGGIFSDGIMMGMAESMVNSAVDRELAHIQIHIPKYSKEKEIKNFIPNGIEAVNQINEMKSVNCVSGRTLIYGMAASPKTTYGVKIIGIKPEESIKVTNLSEKVVEGSYFDSKRKNQIVVGQKLAERLSLRLNSKIILSFQGMDGSIVYIACRIIGIFKTGSTQFDLMNVFVPQKDLFRVLDVNPVVHEIAIRANSAEEIKPIYDQLKIDFSILNVQTWQEISPEMAYIINYMDVFSYIFVGIILFALLFGITNTMLMSVVDRIHELGVLIAIGMKKGKVFSMIILETVFLSLTGGFLGIIIGGATVGYFYNAGIDLSAFASGLESFGSSAVLYPFLPVVMYIVLTMMIIIAANFAAILPAWKAIHLEPSEAIRTY